MQFCTPQSTPRCIKRRQQSPHRNDQQVLSPLIAVGLMWHGGRYAYTALGGLIAVIVYPYLADVENDATAKSSESSEGGQPSDTTKDKRVGRRGRQQQAAGRTGSWPAFRHAVPDWGQHWHKSCGRIYEVEWPDNWVRDISSRCGRSRRGAYKARGQIVVTVVLLRPYSHRPASAWAVPHRRFDCSWVQAHSRFLLEKKRA